MIWEDLISNEALSNYVVFLLGLVAAGSISLARRLWKKGDLVEVERQATASLLELSDRARERLEITYEGRSIDSFHETQFSLPSRASKVIEDIELKLELDPARRQDLYEISVEDPLGGTGRPPVSVECVVEEGDSHHLHINISFLNLYREHKDEVAIRVYAPFEVTAVRAYGGGRGWSARYIDRVAYNERLETLVRESSSWADLLLRASVAGIMRRR